MINRQILQRQIQDELKNKTINPKYRRRLESVLCVLQGNTHKSCAESSEVSLSSLKAWMRILKTQGLDGLKGKPKPDRSRLLTKAVLEGLESDIAKAPHEFGFVQEYWNGNLLKMHLLNNYGKEISERTAQRLLYDFDASSIGYPKPINSVQEQLRRWRKDELKSLQSWIEQESHQEADIWYLGRIFIKREKPPETNRIQLKKPEIGGMICVVNARTNDVHYRYIDLNNSNQYHNAIEDFINDQLSQRKMILLMNKHPWNTQLVKYINNTEELLGRILIKFIHSQLNSNLLAIKELKLGKKSHSKEMIGWIKIPKI